MDISKLKQIKQLVEECISEYGADEGQEDPMEETSEGEAPMEMSDAGGSVSDKIKMAATMMKRAR